MSESETLFSTCLYQLTAQWPGKPARNLFAQRREKPVQGETQLVPAAWQWLGDFMTVPVKKGTRLVLSGVHHRHLILSPPLRRQKYLFLGSLKSSAGRLSLPKQVAWTYYRRACMSFMGAHEGQWNGEGRKTCLNLDETLTLSELIWYFLFLL